MKQLIKFLHECLWEYDFSIYIGKKVILEVAENGSLIIKELEQ